MEKEGLMDTKSISWLYGYMRKYPFKLYFILIMAILEPIAYLIPIFISADIIGILIEGGGWIEVWDLFKILIPISIAQVLLFFLTSFINEILAHRVSTDMTADLFNELQGRSLSYHDSKDVGDIMARASNDTRTINMGISPGLRILMAYISIWFVGLYVIIILLPSFTILVNVISLLLFLFLTYKYGKSIEPLSTKALNKLSEVSSITNDSLVGIRDIKIFTAEKILERKFIKKTTKESEIKEREGKLGAWFYPNLIVRLYTIFIIGYSLFLTVEGILSIRDFVLIVTLMSTVLGMADELNWVSFLSVGTIAAANRLCEYIDEQDHYNYDDGNIKIDQLIPNIKFENVNFSYPSSNQLILNDISFEIKENETLAIVGGPGSGKSTLTKLIQRLYIPNSGRITIGGRNIKDLDNSEFRKFIATVEQEIFLFNDTIYENMKFGKIDAKLDDIMKIAKIAQAEEFIEKLPLGYDTILGENGVKISGGQAQRIAIARALILNPSILIIDDGASALDAKTEKLIQDAIKDILKTRTTLITTHRLAIIAEADKILILDKGQLVGFGSHEELIHNNDYYRNLFEEHYELPEIVRR
ncbi:MAG: ABC transporter ATP-binding protein [Asgard group archaeon]|nr:ABC transporter ATP-binding protein [Asgard group archaeon]